MGSFDRLRFPDACNIIIQNQQQEVLLVQINFKNDQWYLPGGIVEKGESSWQSAERLAKEEMGLNLKVNKLMGLFYRPEKDSYIFMYQATCDDFDFKFSDDVAKHGFYKVDSLPSTMPNEIKSRLVESLKEGAVTMQLQSTKSAD